MPSSLMGNTSELPLFVPDKVRWLVDLQTAPVDLFPRDVYRTISSERYRTGIVAELLPNTAISSLFSPWYRQRLLSRGDFRLNKEQTMETIRRMARDTTYKLYWFTVGGVAVGGIVLHLMSPSEVRVAYRAFDHEVARSARVRQVDYYAELALDNLLATRGVSRLIHGTDKQPLTQLGLSSYKLHIGAHPVIVESVGSATFDPVVHVGYFQTPNERGVYTEFCLFQRVDEARVRTFCTIAERMGIHILVKHVE